MYTVFVEGLEFYAFHGVSQSEKEVGHRFVADIEIEVDGRADETDGIDDTVSYADLVFEAQELATTGPFQTVERVAAVLAEQILSRHPQVQMATVRLAKRLPPLAANVEEVGVEITRER